LLAIDVLSSEEDNLSMNLSSLSDKFLGQIACPEDAYLDHQWLMVWFFHRLSFQILGLLFSFGLVIGIKLVM
jgi:hypothetical protein